MFGVMSSVMFVSLSMLLSPEPGPASARLSQCPHTPAPAPSTGYWGDTDSLATLRSWLWLQWEKFTEVASEMTRADQRCCAYRGSVVRLLRLSSFPRVTTTLNMLKGFSRRVKCNLKLWIVDAVQNAESTFCLPGRTYIFNDSLIVFLKIDYLVWNWSLRESFNGPFVK